MFGVKPAWIGVLRRRLDIPHQPIPPRTKYTEEQWAQVAKRVAEEWPTTEIVAETGVGYSAIRGRYPEVNEYGNQWGAVQRWALAHHRDLLESIRRMEIE